MAIIHRQSDENTNQGTVRMISTARFSVHKLRLHHYRSDLAGGVARAPPPDGYLRNKKNLLAAPNPPFLLASTI